MSHYAMPNIVRSLDLPEHSKAIELFARDGMMSTAQWAYLPESIIGVDIDADYVKKFNDNYPCKGRGVVCDTIKGLKGKSDLDIWNDQYDLISCDNPQGVYGDCYVEHFDIVKDLLKIAAPRAYLILCTNLNPYNFVEHNEDSKDSYGMKQEDYELWMKRREGFYETRAHSLTEKEMIAHYVMAFTSFGRRVKYIASDLRQAPFETHPAHILYVLYQFVG